MVPTSFKDDLSYPLFEISALAFKHYHLKISSFFRL